ncbi:MAG TPA: LPXTG cell wall anchor domain-containing protein [Clostridiaceae bacterium]|nr:LPXTG cell wall anchor domain-containing protein [Clostridiaceae bacterium]
MKRRIFGILLVLCMCLALFPMTVFAAPGEYSESDIKVINNIITNNGLNWPTAPEDGSSVPDVWSSRISWNTASPKQITKLRLISVNLTGILDVSGLTALEQLNCSYNQLTGLNVSGLTALTILDCPDNQLSELDVSSLTALTDLDCSYNQLTELDVSGLSNLTYIGVAYNWLTDVSAVIGHETDYSKCYLQYEPQYKFYTITNILTNIETDNPADRRFENDMTDYTATLAADTGYMLPEEIEVRVGGNPLIRNADYTYDSKSGELVIFGKKPAAVAFKPNCVASGGGSIPRINGNIEIEAAGVPIYSVSVEVSPEGSGSASANPNTGIVGTVITLSAEPDSGWQFKEWQIVEGTFGISENMFKMPASNVIVKAVFEEIPAVLEETVTFDPAGGKWEDGGDDPKIIQAKAGTEITIIEAPVKEGYEFEYWQGSKYQPGDKYQVPKGGHRFTAIWREIAATKPSDPAESTKPSETTTPTETVQTAPKTGENTGTYLIWSSILLVAAGGLLIVLRKQRTSKTN